MRNTCLLLVLILTIIGSVMNTKQTMNYCGQWYTTTECNNRRGCYWDRTDNTCYPNWHNPHPTGI